MRERLVEFIGNLAPTPIAWIAIVVGVFVHFIGFFLFKIEVPGISDLKAPEAKVSFVKLDESEGARDLREQALLSDSCATFPAERIRLWLGDVATDLLSRQPAFGHVAAIFI